MLPVTISLGLINFNLLINSLFGSLVSDQAPAAIDKAFRIYQLPQGIFSVAIATVLFPTLARFASRGEHDNLRATMANGMRQILFVLRARRGGGPGPLRADDPARLPARRVHARADDPGRHGALLVRLLAADQRPLPAAHPHLLQPAAALGADRDRRRQPRHHRARRARLSTTSASAGSSPRRRSRPPPASSPRASSCAASSAASSWAACSTPAIRISIAAAALAAVSFGVWDVLDNALGPRAGRPDRLARLGARRSAGCVYVGAAKLLRIAELDQVTAPRPPPLDARPAALSAGRRRDRPARRLRDARAGRVCARGCCPDVHRAPQPISRPPCSHWRCCSGSPSCWAASVCSSRCRISSASGWSAWDYGWALGEGGGVPPACWVFRRAAGRSRASGQGEKQDAAAPEGYPRPPSRKPSVATLIALAVAAVAVVKFAADVRPKLSTGMTGFDSTWYHGPFAAGFFQSGEHLGPALHRAAVLGLVLPGELRDLPRRSGCWRSTGICSRRC